MAPASRRETLGNLLRERVEWGEWGPRGPRRLTVRERRPLRGGVPTATVTAAPRRPLARDVTWTRNGTRVQTGRDPRGRFARSDWTHSR